MQLFLSYKSADRTSVITVQKLLQARGITTFLDRDNLVLGLAWPQALEQALRAVDGVAVFMGCELGGWQKREMWFALDRQVREEKEDRPFPVIPVLLQGADLTPSFLFLNTWIDLRHGLDDVFTAEALNAFEQAIKATKPVRHYEDSGARVIEYAAAAICPYRGLQIFREEDAAFFAGRKTFAKQLLDFTLDKSLVVVVGPSGSGKSSVVQAGLIPLLRREQPPVNTWDAISFTPGHDPFHRLASALIPLLNPDLSETARLAEAEELGRNLAADKIRVEAVINRVIERSNGTGRLLLVADQFEELFTLTPEPSRRQFARALLHARGNAPVTVLVTLRADFYSQIITLDRELSDVVAPVQVNIGALTPDELRESITAPARLVGLEFESGLVDRILTEVGSEPGRLPLVEFALTEIWHRREGRRLTNRAYDEIGGVAGALARRAEAEFARLNPEEQTGAQRLFSRLVRVARPEEAGEDTRQRTELSEADTLAKCVAKRLADARLLVTGSEAGTGATTVEVAHEVLIRNWERLRGWLNKDREFLLWRQRVSGLLAEWERAKESDEALLRGPLLIEAQKWFDQRSQELSDQERKFITASWERQEQLKRAEKERQEKELKAERLKLFRSRIYATAFAALALLVCGAAWLAYERAEAARRARNDANSLSSFMLVDLREKLESVARVDVLDAAAARTEQYLDALWRETGGSSLRPQILLLGLNVAQIRLSEGRLDEAVRRLRANVEIAVQIQPDEDGITVLLGKSYCALGDALASIGPNSEGQESCLKAIEIFRKLGAKVKDADIQNSLGTALINLGDLQLQVMNVRAAEESYAGGVSVFESLCAAQTASVTDRRGLLRALLHQGNVSLTEARYVLAEQIYLRRQDLADTLSKADPGNTEWKLELALNCDRLTEIYLNMARLEDAERLADEALTIQRQLVSHDPFNTEWKRFLAMILTRHARVLYRKNQEAGALENAREALQINQSLALANPRNLYWRRALATSYSDIADVLATAEPEEALRASDQALALRSELASDKASRAAVEVQLDLTASLVRQARLLIEAGEYYRAKPLLEQAEQIAADLETRYMGQPRTKSHYAGVLATKAILYDDCGDLVSSLRAARTSVSIWASLATQFPAEVHWQHELAVNHEFIANVLREQHDVQSALVEFQTALAIRLALHDQGHTPTAWDKELAQCAKDVHELETLVTH